MRSSMSLSVWQELIHFVIEDAAHTASIHLRILSWRSSRQLRLMARIVRWLASARAASQSYSRTSILWRHRGRRVERRHGVRRRREISPMSQTAWVDTHSPPGICTTRISILHISRFFLPALLRETRDEDARADFIPLPRLLFLIQLGIIRAISLRRDRAPRLRVPIITNRPPAPFQPTKHPKTEPRLPVLLLSRRLCVRSIQVQRGNE